MDKIFGRPITKTERSKIMSAIKGKDSRIEINFRKALCRIGTKYRKNAKNHFGKPDILFKKYKTVVFIDSCFWHGCRYHGKLPKLHRSFWKNKIERNKQRDKEVKDHYKKRGWKIIRFWEHQIKKDPQKAIMKIKKVLKK
jgi:DNA mismatch endonuclease (patch repair protein)